MDLKEGILKHPGIKDNINGYTNDDPKLVSVSFINIVWVFIYTPQKQEIKYQKNIINKELNTKNIINFIFKFFLTWLAFVWLLLKSKFCSNISDFKSKILFSDKDSFFKIISIIDEIIEEYNIWGIWNIKSNIPLSS